MAAENSFSLSVFLYIFNKDASKLLMIKRNEGKRKKWGFDWGIIGGIVEPGELSIEAGIREAQEEIGVTLKEQQIRFLFFEERPSAVHTPAVHFFYAIKLDEHLKITINEESDEFKWQPVNSLPESMLDKERIQKVLQILKH